MCLVYCKVHHICVPVWLTWMEVKWTRITESVYFHMLAIISSSVFQRNKVEVLSSLWCHWQRRENFTALILLNVKQVQCHKVYNMMKGYYSVKLFDLIMPLYRLCLKKAWTLVIIFELIVCNSVRLLDEFCPFKKSGDNRWALCTVSRALAKICWRKKLWKMKSCIKLSPCFVNPSSNAFAFLHLRKVDPLDHLDDQCLLFLL